MSLAKWTAALACAASLFVAASARANEAVPAGDATPEWSVTYNPLTTLFWNAVYDDDKNFRLHLYEFAGEYRLNPNLGVAAILGAGACTITNPKVSCSIPFILGAEARYYPFGSFRRGFVIGPHAQLTRIGMTSTEVSTVRGSVSFLQLGAFLGYKWIIPFGLTLDTQLGPAYWIALGEAHDSANTADQSSFSSSVWAFVGRMSIGWSF